MIYFVLLHFVEIVLNLWYMIDVHGFEGFDTRSVAI